MTSEMSDRQNFFKYNQASLPVQISFPFILTFLGLWVIGCTFLGQHFAKKLDQDQKEKSVELASLVKREIDRDLQNLRKNARLLASDDLITSGVSATDIRALQKEILPFKSILETDITKIIGRDQRPLLDLRQPILKDIGIKDEIVTDVIISGADISTIVSTADGNPPVMIGTSPIKNEQGIVGGIILGMTIGDELLTQINQSIEEQIVVLSNHQPVASTLPLSSTSFQWVQTNKENTRLIWIEGNSFLAKPVVLEGLSEEHFEVVLLISQQPLIEAKRMLWLFVLVSAFVGALLTAIIGYCIARKVAKPIQLITEVALKVVEEGNFDLRAPVNSEDEIGALSNSLNQLIQWVGQYTHELELATHTLEANVEARTQDLSSTLEQLKETQFQLIQTEKMSSLGQMVAGIAHEINNPINFIQGNLKPLNAYFQDITELLETYHSEYPHPTAAVIEKREDIELDFLLEDTAKILESMKMGTQRVRDIVVSLRNFSRLDEATIKDVDLHEGIDSTLLILSHRIKEGVTVVKNYGSLPLVKCSPAQINQVFTNITANALDAMFEADLETKQLTITTKRMGTEQVAISIRDSGPGIPDAVKAKIFDPFFTTKAIGKGTGIGLGICFKIVQQHQGSIEVNSEVGQGTEFLITLPKVAQIDD